MKVIGDCWEILVPDQNGRMVRSGIEGHKEYEIEFNAEWTDGKNEVYFVNRKTFKAALNDAKRYLKKTGRECDIYSNWKVKIVNDTEGGKVEHSYVDSARLGTMMNGEYFDLCEDVPFKYK